MNFGTVPFFTPLRAGILASHCVSERAQAPELSSELSDGGFGACSYSEVQSQRAPDPDEPAHTSYAPHARILSRSASQSRVKWNPCQPAFSAPWQLSSESSTKRHVSGATENVSQNRW